MKPILQLSHTITTTDNTLRHLTFDDSLQPSIITIASDGKIIMANAAACKLLGYSKKRLVAKKRSAIFDIDEANFKAMLKQRAAEGKSLASVTVIKKNGIRLPCELMSAVFMDEDGIEKAILSFKDMSQHILKQKKIDTEKEKIVAADIVLVKSVQKIIDSKKEKIVTHNIALAKSKQKAIDIKKEKVVALNVIKAQAKSDARLAVNNEWIKYIAKTSYDVMWDWDISTGKIYIGDSIEEVFGYKVQNNTADFKNFTSCLLPEEKDKIEKKLLKTLASRKKSWNDSYMFKRYDGSVAFTTSRASIIRNAKGKALHLIGNMQDVTKIQELKQRLDEKVTVNNRDNKNLSETMNEPGMQVVLEEKLEQEIKLREKQVADAMEEAREATRLEIGRELHDNINQLLGASRLYLDVAKRGGKDSEIFLNRSSDCTLVAIEEIRKLTKGLTTDIIKEQGLCSSIENVSRETMQVNPVKISCILGSFTEHSVNDKFKLNVFRIVQEQLNNIIKHSKATKATIKLIQNKGSIVLSISDNGVGFNTCRDQQGIGLANIKSRAASYNGTADFISQPGKGCILTVTLPLIAIT